MQDWIEEGGKAQQCVTAWLELRGGERVRNAGFINKGGIFDAGFGEILCSPHCGPKFRSCSLKKVAK